MVASIAALVFFSRPSGTNNAVKETRTTSLFTDTSETTTDHKTTLNEVTVSGVAKYKTPTHYTHVLDVTLNLDDRRVTSLSVLYDGHEAQTPQHKAFASAISEEVLEKNIANLSLVRVGGASLTTRAFNEALAEIKKQLS